ncbi:MAG: glycosyltransferase [Bacteroidia bacterium]|nr:glycosyltransferase [Bacteroidia bacterium]
MNNKKVLILFDGKFPGESAAYSRIIKYIKGLQENGVQAQIVSPVPSKKIIKNQVFEKDDISYSYMKDSPFFNHILVNRINIFLMSFYAFYYCLKQSGNQESVFIYGFGWLSKFLMIIAFRFSYEKVFIEVNENPYSMEDFRLKRLTFISTCNRWMLFNTVFRLVDGFVVISDKLEQLVSNYKKKSATVLKIPILVEAVEYPLSLKDAFPETDPFIIHTGSIYEQKDGIISVFKAFVKASSKTDRNIRFIITGTKSKIPQQKEIDTILSKNGLKERVIYTGPINEEELKRYRKCCTMAIVNRPENFQNDYNFPTKLGEYLIAGVPVIASNSGEMVKYLTDGENAFLVEPNDSEAIAQRIIFILENSDKAKAIGERGRMLALKHFNYKNHGKRLSSFLTGSID